MTSRRGVSARGISPNLALNQLVAQRRASGESIVHLGFGEARLPVFPPLLERLAAGAGRNAYGPVAGDAAAKRAVAGYFTRRRMPTEPEQVIIAPGSKPLLIALHLAVHGDVLLPRPCWNTYAPQAELAGKTTWGIPIPDECGGVPDPIALRETLRAARASGHDPRILMLTLPDNPTGTLASPELLRQICAIAEEEDLLIVSDEIYRDTVHDPNTPMVSPAELAPERTVVTGGLSKSHALGGWRIGVARFPEGPWGSEIRDAVTGLASEIWSTLAGPMQEVAAYVYDEPAELNEHVAAVTRLHGTVARAVHQSMVAAGAVCRPPTGGFYVYPDFAPMREMLARRAITDSASLQRQLLDEFGIAVLAGHDLGDDMQALRFKAATGQLYGDTAEEQWSAVLSDDPLRLPHVGDILARIEGSFMKLCG